MGITGEKPKKPHQHLGTDVKLTSKALENDKWAQRVLRDLGQYFGNLDREQDVEYLGSVAIHVYRSTATVTGAGKYGMAQVNQLAIGDISEFWLNAALSNFIIEIKKHYGRRHLTTDTADTRGNS